MNSRRRPAIEGGAARTPFRAWDDRLGLELREAPIPPHGVHHFERIRARIQEIEDGRGGGDAAEPRTLAAPAPAVRRPVVRLAALAAIAAAIVAAVAFSWSGLPGLRSSAPPAATAATVLEKVQHAMAELGSISGDVVEYGTARGHPFAHKVGSFVFTDEGDYRIEQSDLGVQYTYDAATRAAQRIVHQDGRVVYGEQVVGLPDPGPFAAPWPGVSQVLDRSIAAYARAVIAEAGPDVVVTPVMYEGRTAWRIDVPEQLPGGGSGSVGIVVDAAAGYPLLVEHWSAGGEVSGTRIEHVRVEVGSGPPPASSPPDAAPALVKLSEGYRRMSLSQAAHLGELMTRRAPSNGRRGEGSAAAPFRPLMPVWTPRGFHLEGVTGAVNGAVLGRYDAPRREGRADTLTAVLTYRRGFDRFCVISRWRRANGPGSDDPLGEGTVTSPFARPVTLTEGALRGAPARVVIGLSEWPHLWAATGAGRTVSVAIAGDLTRDELLRVASSLQSIAVP